MTDSRDNPAKKGQSRKTCHLQEGNKVTGKEETYEIRCFDESKHKSAGDESSVRLAASGSARYDSPYNHASRKIKCWLANLVQEEITRYLHENIADKEDTDGRLFRFGQPVLHPMLSLGSLR